jgi:hypothetical protein
MRYRLRHHPMVDDQVSVVTRLADKHVSVLADVAIPANQPAVNLRIVV